MGAQRGGRGEVAGELGLAQRRVDLLVAEVMEEDGGASLAALGARDQVVEALGHARRDRAQAQRADGLAAGAGRGGMWDGLLRGRRPAFAGLGAEGDGLGLGAGAAGTADAGHEGEIGAPARAGKAPGPAASARPGPRRGLAAGARACHPCAPRLPRARGVALTVPPLSPEEVPALVVGAGPAGLMAADAVAEAGHRVLLCDAMPSPARKLLMAGKSGLNLTKDEPDAIFRAAFDPFGAPLPPALEAALRDFGPREATAWARSLGQGTFTGSTGRVFPVAWKASPLLRAWLARLEARGARLRTRWRWEGFEDGDGHGSRFATPEGPRALRAGATVLALGGATWRRLGSDGTWAASLPDVTPFLPANAGLRVDWSPHMAPRFGQPVKGVAWRAGPLASRGEAVVSARGLEGGGIYPLTPALRGGAPLVLDLLPDLAEAEVRARLGPAGKASLANRLRQRLRLDGVRLALLQEWGRPLPADPSALLKALPVRHAGLRPLDEAISSAGGLRLDALDGDLMLRGRPGTFAAGEMLDWEAPTGGYLLTACLATGRRAGRAAARRLGLPAAARPQP